MFEKVAEFPHFEWQYLPELAFVAIPIVCCFAMEILTISLDNFPFIPIGTDGEIKDIPFIADIMGVKKPNDQGQFERNIFDFSL